MIQLCLGNNATLAKKVKVDLYYESLCPGSADFIVNDLPIIFKNGLINIVDLHLFPWGNARVDGNENFTCQHGKDECLLNTAAACAIDALPAVEDHVPFIHCTEYKVVQGNYSKWNECIPDVGLDPTLFNACYTGVRGKTLEKMYADDTAKLIPPHKFVPWVVVNDKPLEDKMEQYVSYICEAYEGPPPSACKQKSQASVSRRKRITTLNLSAKRKRSQRCHS